MDAETSHSGSLFRAICSIVVACVFIGPAFAGDDVRVVPLASDDRGNQAWVEIGSSGNRTTATPFVGGDDVKKLLENQDENKALAIPVPQVMRLVERARRTLRDMKRPGPGPPAGPDAATAAPAQPAAPAAEPRETGRRPAVSIVPPERSGAAIRPPAALFSSASR